MVACEVVTHTLHDDNWSGTSMSYPRDQRHMDGHVAKRHCCPWKAIHGVNRDSRLRVSARWDTIAEKRDIYDRAPEANQSPVEKFRLFPKWVELWQYHSAGQTCDTYLRTFANLFSCSVDCSHFDARVLKSTRVMDDRVFEFVDRIR